MTGVLVTGGAGYIGSHIVRRLTEDGRRVVVVDDLSHGHRAAVGDAELIRADFADRTMLDRVLGAGNVRHVVHMAASCLVGESMTDPGAYYANNLVRSLALLDAVVRHRAGGIVFSSSAAVYGEAREIPIPEPHPVEPTNPYGETKLAFERALRWTHRAHGVGSVSLRYFNAAGAHPSGELGEDHGPETHLIPLLLAAAAGTGPEVALYGDDYPTDDGTCVRDYVHVADLAEAHVLALRRLESGEAGCEVFNLGNGRGFSVREVVAAVRRVTGIDPPTRTAPRRPGDPAALVASSDAARRVLGWAPAHASIDAIVASAWAWHRRHPRGYDDRRAVEEGGDRH